VGKWKTRIPSLYRVSLELTEVDARAAASIIESVIVAH